MKLPGMQSPGEDVARPGTRLRTRTASRLARLLLGFAAILLAPPVLVRNPGRAADPVAYEVTIAPTGDAGIDAALQSASTLISLRQTAPVGSFALLARARADVARFATVLQSDGYYASTEKVTVAGRSLDDPGLPDALDALPAGASVKVEVAITRGTLFHLRRVEIDGAVPSGARQALGLEPGAPARAADVLAGGQRLLDSLKSQGYALAKVSPPQATLVPAADALDVAFPVSTGPRVDIGPITFTGMDRLTEAYVRRRFGLMPGVRYDPAVLDRARRDLAASGAIAGVRIDPADAVDADGRLPLHVEVTERPLRSVSFTAAWSTDQGGSVLASWMHRDLFGGAEQLTLSAAATNLGGTASEQPGYNLSAQLLLPDWQRRDQSLTFFLTGLKESLQAYDRTAVIASATLSRKLTDQLSASVGLQLEQARFLQEHVTRNYSLAQVPIGLTWDSTTNLFDPASGVRASATVTPSTSFANDAGSNNAFFVIGQASAAAYFDAGAWLGGTPARSIVAMRGAGRRGRGRQPVRHPARPALLCRRRRHHPRLPLPVGRAAIPQRSADRRHRDRRRHAGIPPADPATAGAWRRSSMPGRSAPPARRSPARSRSAPASACGISPRSGRCGSMWRCRWCMSATAIRSRSISALGQAF